MAEGNDKLVFSILNYLTKVSQDKPAGVDTESLEVAIQCIQQAFNVNFEDPEQKERNAVPISLEKIFAIGVAGTNIMNSLTGKKQEAKEAPKQSKFHGYLKLLHEKGYFAGVEEGSEEYKARLTKAQAAFDASEEKERLANLEAAEKKKTEGNELLQQKKIEEAIVCYDEAIKLNPNSAIYFANRAAAHSSLRNHEKAIEDCKSAIKIDANYFKAYSRLGLAHFSLGQYKEAVDVYRRAQQLEPENASIKESLAIAEKKLGEKQAPPQPAAGGAPGGGLDFASLLNNPAIANLVNSFQSQMQTPAAEAEDEEEEEAPSPAPAPAAGGVPNIASMLNNPELLSTASQMLNNPEVGNLLNNPGVMNMASQMLQNPDLLSGLMSSFLGGKK